MSRYHEVGMTVLAIRDGGSGGLNIFGEGVYIGDRLRPGCDGPVPEEDRAAILAVFADDDATPLAENRLTRFAVSVAEAHGRDVEEARAVSIARIEAERAKPMEVRVRELWESTNQNPCIYLDSGDIVWGFQCWWGALAGANAKYPEHEVPRTLVPVPAGNERWK